MYVCVCVCVCEYINDIANTFQALVSTGMLSLTFSHSRTILSVPLFVSPMHTTNRSGFNRPFLQKFPPHTQTHKE